MSTSDLHRVIVHADVARNADFCKADVATEGTPA